MNSCLYELRIFHERRWPKVYRFTHHVFMFYLDLKEIDLIAQKTFLFGHNQRNVYNFCETDHIGNVRDYLATQGVGGVEDVRLLTNVRTFGYVFNPVSFYFCFDAGQQPICVVVEIGNTFHELKYFFLGKDRRQEKVFKDKQVKHYYISPFTDLDNVLDFNIQVPDDSLKITIDVLKDNKKFLFSSMVDKRREISSRNLLWQTIKFPFITLKVIFLIHWHAAVLHFVQRLGHKAKEANAHLQCQVNRKWSK